jgi:hypothetical protein
MSILIRNATIDDAHDISRVRIETWRTTYRGIVPDQVLDQMNIEEEAERRRGWLEKPMPKVETFVAEAEGEGVVGFAMVGPARDKLEGVDGA